MSQRPALAIFATDHEGTHLLAAGPYRNGARAEAVAAAVARVLLGHPGGAEVSIVPLGDGPQTPAQAAQTVGLRAWGDAWGSPGSTSGEDPKSTHWDHRAADDEEEEL